MSEGISGIITIKNLLKISGEEWAALKFSKLKEEFYSDDKGISPYNKLYNWVFSQIERKEWMSVSDIFLKKEDLSELDELTKNWMRESLKLSKIRVQNQFPFYQMDMSPAVFDEEKEKWVEPGYVYIRVSDQTRNEEDEQ
jgi:hypothetical protein